MTALPANWWLTWLIRSRTLLVEHRSLLNRINVFPVADADTGANLTATVGRAADSAGMAEEPALTAAARAALRGARGNSGTLVAVWLLGVARSLDGTDTPGAGELTGALSEGAQAARTALSNPADGTALTVLDALAGVPVTPELATYAGNLAAAALDAVRSTAQAEHARNGWVDSGALGVFLMVIALHTVMVGSQPELDYSDLLTAPPATDMRSLARSARSIGGAEPQVEVMCDIYLPVYEITQLRSALDTVGGSVSIAQIEAGNEANWAVHVHVHRQEDALKILTAAGEPRNVRVTALDTCQHEGQA